MRPLTQTEKEHLRAYIPEVDLENARLHDGNVPWYLWKQFRAITRGNHIYCRPGAYDARSPAGLALLAHELVHVGQYREGMTWLTYLLSTVLGYRRSKYELPAFALQRQVESKFAVPALVETC